MPEYTQEQTKLTNGNPQEEQHPKQPIEVQPDGTWILGRGADRWIPSKNQIGDLRWVVERDLRKELGVPPKWAWDWEKIEFHKRQLALLDIAKQSPRCEHVFSDGRCCKAPRVKKGKLCYAHTLMEEKRPQEWNLPPLEDPNAVMLWLMDVLRGLLEGRISEKTAGLMFYGLQLAMVNVRLTTFGNVDPAEMMRKAPKLRTGTKPQRTRRSTKKDFTAGVAENAEENQVAPAAAPGNGQDRTESPESEAKSLPLRTQRDTEEKAAEDFAAEIAEPPEAESQEEGTASRVEARLEPQDAEVNPGVESAKSIFFGVEVGEGVADNCPVTPPSEPPRKSGQKEILTVPEEVKHHAQGG